MPKLLQTITAHYLVFVFLTSLGMLQLAGARSGTRRLLLLRGRRASGSLGVALLLGGYYYFFTQASYGMPGLEGAQLFFEFAGAAFVAILVCAAVNVLRSGQVGTARRALGASLRESTQELRPLFSPQRRRRAKDEAR